MSAKLSFSQKNQKNDIVFFFKKDIPLKKLEIEIGIKNIKELEKFLKKKK